MNTQYAKVIAIKLYFPCKSSIHRYNFVAQSQCSYMMLALLNILNPSSSQTEAYTAKTANKYGNYGMIVNVTHTVQVTDFHGGVV